MASPKVLRLLLGLAEFHRHKGGHPFPFSFLSSLRQNKFVSRGVSDDPDLVEVVFVANALQNHLGALGSFFADGSERKDGSHYLHSTWLPGVLHELQNLVEYFPDFVISRRQPCLPHLYLIRESKPNYRGVLCLSCHTSQANAEEEEKDKPRWTHTLSPPCQPTIVDAI